MQTELFLLAALLLWLGAKGEEIYLHCTDGSNRCQQNERTGQVGHTDSGKDQEQTNVRVRR